MSPEHVQRFLEELDEWAARERPSLQAVAKGMDEHTRGTDFSERKSQKELKEEKRGAPALQLR